MVRTEEIGTGTTVYWVYIPPFGPVEHLARVLLTLLAAHVLTSFIVKVENHCANLLQAFHVKRRFLGWPDLL